MCTCVPAGVVGSISSAMSGFRSCPSIEIPKKHILTVIDMSKFTSDIVSWDNNNSYGSVKTIRSKIISSQLIECMYVINLINKPNVVSVQNATLQYRVAKEIVNERRR